MPTSARRRGPGRWRRARSRRGGRRRPRRARRWPASGRGGRCRRRGRARAPGRRRSRSRAPASTSSPPSSARREQPLDVAAGHVGADDERRARPPRRSRRRGPRGGARRAAPSPASRGAPGPAPSRPPRGVEQRDRDLAAGLALVARQDRRPCGRRGRGSRPIARWSATRSGVPSGSGAAAGEAGSPPEPLSAWGGSSRVPHESQNVAPSRFSLPHEGHFIGAFVVRRRHDAAFAVPPAPPLAAIVSRS